MAKTETKRSINAKQVISGTLMGAAIGAITSLLLAPKTGRELRKDISKQMVNTKDNTVVITKKFGNSAKGKLTNVKQTASATSKKITDKVKAQRQNKQKLENQQADVEIHSAKKELAAANEAKK